ncbi:ATP-binding protein [Streptomyces sp. NPDC017179]|uniref:ATP-binding protein n=1 Tax=Streptomyces sp. NPDC017179 TaxID=3364979 RepID=UPI00378CFD6C
MEDSPVPPGVTNNQISGGVFFQSVIQGRDITVQLPPNVTPALSGLPRSSDSFAGREDELSSLLAALAPDHSPTTSVLTSLLTGMAGVGKTELVLHAARFALRQEWFPGGVLFVDLFGYDDERCVSPERALEGFLRALGMPPEHIPSDVQDRSRLYSSVLSSYAAQGQRILVVLDNASSAEQIMPLLPADESTATVITSRHTLAGLAARVHELHLLTPTAAVDVLGRVVQRSRGSEDRRISREKGQAERIAELCGYLPLALQIVGALLADDPQRPLAAMADDLQDAQVRLDELQREEQAVRAAFDLSYTRLTKDQANLFRLLSVNPGPDLSTESAAHLFGTDQRSVRRLLESLARAHLIEPASVYGRWRMHDLVHLYAREHAAADSKEIRDARDRLFGHYLGSARAACAHFSKQVGMGRSESFSGVHDALSWLDGERLNLLAASATSCEFGMLEICLGLANQLGHYFGYQHRFDDWLIVARAALDAAQRHGSVSNKAVALSNLGLALYLSGQLAEAITTLRNASEIFRELKLSHAQATALDNLGMALRDVGHTEDAITAHKESYRAFRHFGDRHGQARAQANLGAALKATQRFHESITAQKEALRIFRNINDRAGTAGTLNNLSLTYEKIGKNEDAIAASRQAVSIMREIGSQADTAIAINRLANALSVVGRHDEALPFFAEYVDTLRAVEGQSGIAPALGNLGLALLHVNQHERALPALQEAAERFRESGEKEGEARALNHLGVALNGMGQHDEALAAFDKAASLIPEISDNEVKLGILINLDQAHERLQESMSSKHE